MSIVYYCFVPSFKIVRSFYFLAMSDRRMRLGGNKHRKSPKVKKKEHLLKVSTFSFRKNDRAKRLLVLRHSFV